MDFSEMKGNENVKRILEIAILGEFKVMLIGGLSSGRSMAVSIVYRAVPASENNVLIHTFDKCVCNFKNCVCTDDESTDHRINLINTFIEKEYDMYIDMEYVLFDKLISDKKLETTKDVMKRVLGAANYTDIILCETSKALMKNAYEKLDMYPIDIKKIIKIARVIANLDTIEKIQAEHIAKAIQYRLR